MLSTEYIDSQHAVDINALRQLISATETRRVAWKEWAAEGLIFSREVFRSSLYDLFHRAVHVENTRLRLRVQMSILPTTMPVDWFGAAAFLAEIHEKLINILHKEESE